MAQRRLEPTTVEWVNKVNSTFEAIANWAVAHGQGRKDVFRGARLSIVVSFDSANQAKLMGEGANIKAPGTHIYDSKTPLKTKRPEI